MFGKDSGMNGSPSHNNDTNNTSADYLRLAAAAKASGDAASATHLYVLAFHKATEQGKKPDAEAIEGLRAAWELACEMKERSLAEYIFEMLEPYSGSEEVARNAERLQRLALEKLEEFGFSREDVQEMADMLSEDFLGMGGIMQFTNDALVTHPIAAVRAKKPKGLGTSHAKQAVGSGAASDAHGDMPASAHREEEASADLAKQGAQAPAKGAGDAAAQEAEEPFRYDDLIGYDAAIEQMHGYGIGMADDKRFNDFLTMLSRRHGIDAPPSIETMVFRAYAREDANQFMAATVGELAQPTVRMYMEETPQGVPVLCVMASSDFKPRLHAARGGFDGPAVLMLEDIDLWGSPLAGSLDEMDASAFSQLSRGAREAVSLIRAAVENSEVTVLATCSTDRPLEDFFFDLLDPMVVIDIEVPTREERAAVWEHAATLYPSLRFLDREELVVLSAHMSRYDIYMAAREAVEQAYRMSIERRAYVPVTRDNIFDKIAAYQPLDSDEYHKLEDAAVESLRDDLDHINDPLEGSAQ